MKYIFLSLMFALSLNLSAQTKSTDRLEKLVDREMAMIKKDLTADHALTLAQESKIRSYVVQKQKKLSILRSQGLDKLSLSKKSEAIYHEFYPAIVAVLNDAQAEKYKESPRNRGLRKN